MDEMGKIASALVVIGSLAGGFAGIWSAKFPILIPDGETIQISIKMALTLFELLVFASVVVSIFINGHRRQIRELNAVVGKLSAHPHTQAAGKRSR